MHPNAKYVFIASMDVDPDKEAVFNAVYDTEHIFPMILQVPGVRSAWRYVAESLQMISGGFEPPIMLRENHELLLVVRAAARGGDADHE